VPTATPRRRAIFRARLSTAIAVVLVVVAVAVVELAPGSPTPARQSRGGGDSQGLTGRMPRNYHVSASGNDDADGSSPGTPWRSIQKALDEAAPGSVVELAAGEYLQDVRTRRDGLVDAPITVKGPREAVVRGGGGGHVVEVNHDFHVLTGFTIDGLVGRPDERSGYRSKLLWVQRTQPGAGVTGLRVHGMVIRNALGECVRLRYSAVANEIAHSIIANCGREDYAFGGDSKNGEGVYIGTAPEQRANGVNPTSETDRSNRNRIHDNVIETNGNECIDVKEGSSENVLEENSCTGQRDADSGGIGVRGNGNVLRRNVIFGNVGPGIRLGGDGADDGTHNDVYDNTIRDNRGGGVKFVRAPQGRICGNSMSGNAREAVGDLAGSFSPSTPCT